MEVRFYCCYILTLIRRKSIRNQRKVGLLMTIVSTLGLLVVAANFVLMNFAMCQEGLHTAAFVGTVVMAVGIIFKILVGLIIVFKSGDTYSE
jgi:hypothetical protein